MAFSIPIVKKDYDIYNSNKHRQRRLSDCSNSKSAVATARHKTSVGSMQKPVSKSVGHSTNATPIGSSHVTTPTRRYSSTSRPPSCSSSSNSHTAPASKYDANLQKSKSLHTVTNHGHGAGSSLGASSKTAPHSSQHSLARFHTKLVDRLKSSITCSSSKKSPSPGSSKSTGHLDKRGGS